MQTRDEELEWQTRFWQALESRFSSLVEAFALFEGSRGRVTYCQFSAALDGAIFQERVGIVLPKSGRARHVVFDSLRQGGDGDGEGFAEGDMVRAHSCWRKRVATCTASAIDSAIVIPEPDALAKTNDVRLPHQLLTKDDIEPPRGKNKKWYYPQPSMEMEARRVLDFWRGHASRPWSSKQEAAQHFRRAFAFFDTQGSGRINYDAFKAGVVRLRYGLPEAHTRRLFDTMDVRSAGLITHSDMAAPLYQPQGGWNPWQVATVPKAWLRHNRLTSFDTRCQYLYFCTSKARAGDSICTCPSKARRCSLCLLY